MKRLLGLCTVFGILTYDVVFAADDAPRVVTDIAPVQSLVAMVMDGVDQPDVVVRGAVSPHTFTLRPSMARAIQQADLIVWIGPELTPWLEKNIDKEQRSLPLLQVPEIRLLEARDLPVFAESGHAEKHDDDHDHDHDHGSTDAHAWLDPENAQVWVMAIADALITLDPERAATYRANAEKAQNDLAALTKSLESRLQPVQGVRYLVYHDAFQYFGTRFNVPAAAAIQSRDAQTPGAARIAKLRAALREQPVSCAMTEPQLTNKLVETVAGADLPVVELDPLGAAIPLGSQHYFATLQGMAAAFENCRTE